MIWATKVFTLCILGIFLHEGITPVHAVVRRYRFEVMNSVYSRLCINKTMLTINGQFPGPTIYARRGDMVIVDVINNGDRNLTIHWHGVKNPRYPWSDGPQYVTQCPITPGKRFTQRIILSDEEGTLWYHAHSDWTRATVHGSIIILPPKKETYPFPKPHAEVPILLGEWWNSDVQDILNEFYERGRDSNVSDAFLINGQPGDLYPCSKQDTFKLRVESGKTYLFRVVNAMLDYIIYFRIAKHNVTVVGSDGAYTKPLTSDYVAISPGATFDFLMEANQPPSHYYMSARAYATGAHYIDATGIIEYIGNYTPPPKPSRPVYPYYYPEWPKSSDFTSQLRSLANEKYPIDVPMNVTHNLFYAVAINHWPCTNISCREPERLLASINNVSMVLAKGNDILHAYYRGMRGVHATVIPDNPPLAYDYTQGSISRNESAYPQFGASLKMLEYNATVEIVFQGTNLHKIDHPMHLHGHSFYVLGCGTGNFDPIRDPPNYNLVDPPLLNTFGVPRTGWATIRFKANNPGVWYMHCHFERHLSWGMKMVFIVKDGKRPNEKMLPPPPDMPVCGEKFSSDSLLSSVTGKINNNPINSETHIYRS